jgi:hypothetical protein
MAEEIFSVEEAAPNANPPHMHFVCPLLLRAVGEGTYRYASHRAFNLDTPRGAIRQYGPQTTIIAIASTAATDYLYLLEIAKGLEVAETHQEALNAALPGTCGSCGVCAPEVRPHIATEPEGDEFDAMLVVPRLIPRYMKKSIS